MSVVVEKTVFDSFTHSAEVPGFYLSYAIEKIDNELGEGYAAYHPELITTYMKLAHKDYKISEARISKATNVTERESHSASAKQRFRR